MTKLTFWQRIGGLWLDERTGLAVGTKLASSTGYFITACLFVYHNITTGYNETMWMIFLATFSLHKSAEKLIGMKYANKEKKEENDV